MRPDAMIDDIPLLMCGVGSASAMEHPRPDAWRRHLGIVLDGLRARGRLQHADAPHGRPRSVGA